MKITIDTSCLSSTGVEKGMLCGPTKKALTLCYPSLYDGFGFPPLEVMSLGVPVLAGKSSAIPETVGNAALLVDLNQIEEIAPAIQELIENNGLREDLIQKGFSKAASFTWEETAEKAEHVFQKAINRGQCRRQAS